MRFKTILLSTLIVATTAIAKPTTLPDGAIKGIGHIPFDNLPLNAVLVVTQFIPHEPPPPGNIVYGTEFNDIIDVTGSEYYEGALVDPLGGSDVVYINRWQNVFARPGNDVIIGIINDDGDTPGYGAWDSPTPVNVNLETGIAEDGYGYTDRITNMRVVHLDSGTVIGSSADESIFSFPFGNKSLHMAGGVDKIYYYEMPSTDYVIEIVGTTVYVEHNDSVDTITGAEFLLFSDITYEIVYPVN